MRCMNQSKTWKVGTILRRPTTYQVSSDVVSAAVGLPEAAVAVTDPKTRRSLHSSALRHRRLTVPPTRATSAFA